MSGTDGKPLTYGSLFTGIGGFDLGFDRAGMVCKWQVEIETYCNRVLEKHWPNVRRWLDVRTWPQPDTERVDVICGGFPCQPHSVCGQMQGSGDDRDLWKWFANIIRVLQPRYAVIENVTGIFATDAGRFFGRVLGDLAEIGFDAEWETIPAHAFGASHVRPRVFIVAYTKGTRPPIWQWRSREGAKADSQATQTKSVSRFTGCRCGFSLGDSEVWSAEPDVGRVVTRVPDRTHRLVALGNAVVPAVAEWIGRRIMEAAST